MYWVRGNRYQIFELEPIKALLPPHDDALLELFGVSSSAVIDGLENSGILFRKDTQMPLWNSTKNMTYSLKLLTQVLVLRPHLNAVKVELQRLLGSYWGVI